MRRPWAFAAPLLVLLSLAGSAVAAPVQVIPNHPIVGTWSWNRPNSGCRESFEFRANGTARVVSADEVTDATYLVDRDKDERRFYQLELRTTKDNGGKDCDGDAKDNTGDKNSMYVFINSEGTMLVLCSEASFDACFGPLERRTKR